METACRTSSVQLRLRSAAFLGATEKPQWDSSMVRIVPSFAVCLHNLHCDRGCTFSSFDLRFVMTSADGDDDGGSSFLANIHKEQKKLDNLAPSSKISDVKVVVGKGCAPFQHVCDRRFGSCHCCDSSARKEGCHIVLLLQNDWSSHKSRTLCNR